MIGLAMPPSWLQLQRKWFIYVGVFSLAALPRVLYLLVTNPPFDGYHWSLSDNLLKYGSLGFDGLKTSQYEPLYPIFLSFARVVTGGHLPMVRLLQAAVDSLGAVCLYLLAEALTGRPRTALFSATLFALYPLLIRHSVVVGEFSLLSTLLIGFAYAASTATNMTRAALAGLWIGLAILTRAMILPVPALTVGALMAGHRTKMALVFAVTTAAVTSPWLLRNYLLNGAMWPTRSGVNLLIGNSRYTAALLPDHSPDVLTLTDYVDSFVARERPALDVDAPANEKDVDALLTARAFEEMRARPLETLGLTTRKAVYFFWPRLVPSRLIVSGTQAELGTDGRVRVQNSPERPAGDDLAYTVSYCMVAAAALVGVWARRRKVGRDLMLWSIVLTFVVTYAVYFPATRYRVPMEFVLLFYAAVGLEAATRLSGTERDRPGFRATLRRALVD